MWRAPRPTDRGPCGRPGLTIATPGAPPATLTQRRRFCWSRASSTHTTSCSSRRGRAAETRSSRHRSTHRTSPRRPPSTRTSPPNRPPRSHTATRTPPATDRSAPSPARTRKKAQEYRDLYHRLHAEVDAPLDRGATRRHGRRAPMRSSCRPPITATSSAPTVVSTRSGSTLYDEATRVPFSIARVGTAPTAGAVVDGAPDLACRHRADAARGGRDRRVDRSRACCEKDFTEVHPLPGNSLMPVVDEPANADRDRPGVPHDQRQHARRRHRRLGRRPSAPVGR